MLNSSQTSDIYLVDIRLGLQSYSMTEYYETRSIVILVAFLSTKSTN